MLVIFVSIAEIFYINFAKCTFAVNETSWNITDDVRECRMVPICGSVIVVWAYGIEGQCFPNDVGSPFGKNHYSKIILQNHYNNELQKPGYVDSSGVKLYYVKRQRPIERGLIALGDQFIKVPPLTPYVESTNILPSSCSQQLFQPEKKYQIMSMLFHIHKQGSFGRLVIDKKNAGYKIIVVNETLSYDRPYVATWDPPLVLEPGDEITSTCGFSSMNKKEWTFFGAETSDEMCFIFIDIFPRPHDVNFMFLPGFGTVDYCTAYMTENDPGQSWHVGECTFGKLHEKLGLQFGIPGEKSEIAAEMLDSCSCQGPTNFPARTCSSSCFSFMNKYNMFNEPCLDSEEVWQVAMQPFFDQMDRPLRARSQMAECDKVTEAPEAGKLCSDWDNGATMPSQGLFGATLIALIVAKLFVY